MCTKPGKALACACWRWRWAAARPPPPPGRAHRVAIVAKSTRTEFWLSVFAGAQAAAAEYNVELDISGPETRRTTRPRTAWWPRPWTPGPKRWCFPPLTTRTTPPPSTRRGRRRGAHRVAIDSNVDSAAVQTYIGTDNYAAGQMAAQAALDAVDGELTVGIDQL